MKKMSSTRNTAFSFQTYSEAARAYDRLQAGNIHARITRTPASAHRSCGYSVKVSPADADTARRLVTGAPYRFYWGRHTKSEKGMRRPHALIH